jgi:hypothetical protein
MLEGKVIARIRESIEALTAPRQRTLLEELQRDEAFINGRGLLGSSAAANKYIATASDELKVRANIVWTAIRRAHGSLVGQYAEGTLQDLRDQLAEHIRAQAASVRYTTLDRMKNHQPNDGMIRGALDTVAGELLREANVEAEYYVDQLHGAGQTAAGASVIIHGNVGAVQTGTYATAHVSMSVHDRDRLVGALEALRQAIQQNAEATAEQRDQGTELVGDIISAVTAEKPNPPKISGLLGGLATTVQTVASLRGAWEFVRDAAIAVGLLIKP